MKELSPREMDFCERYLTSLNAGRAAQEAGYATGPDARKQGHILLKRPAVQEYLDRLIQERSTRTRISADRVLQELARLAFADIAAAFDANGQLKPLHEIDPDTRAAIGDISENVSESGVSRRVKFGDKIRALELIGKHIGMFSDRITLAGDKENPLALLLQSVQGQTIRPVPDDEIRRREEERLAIH